MKNEAMTIIQTQTELVTYMATHPGRVDDVVLVPIEAMDLDPWLAPFECCSFCDTPTPGLRLSPDGDPAEDCVVCLESGHLVTIWGTESVDQWKAKVPRPKMLAHPRLHPVRVGGGNRNHVADIERQALRAMMPVDRQPLRYHTAEMTSVVLGAIRRAAANMEPLDDEEEAAIDAEVMKAVLRLPDRAAQAMDGKQRRAMVYIWDSTDIQVEHDEMFSAKVQHRLVMALFKAGIRIEIDRFDSRLAPMLFANVDDIRVVGRGGSR